MATDRYAVIGHPIGHSKSPVIHGAFARALGDSLDYQAIDVAPEALAGRLAELHASGYRGLNVTLPFKTEALTLCTSLSEAAQRAGAVNTLVADGDGWAGDNTDGSGLLADLRRLGLEPEGRRVLLLGAGGAARGVIGPLLGAGPSELVVSNRNPWKPEALAERFRGHGPLRPCTHLALKGDRFDLIINATSAGHAGTLPRLPEGLAADGAVAYDLSYGEAFVPFRRWAEAQGLPVHDGLGMLVEQAADAYARFRGTRPPTAEVLAALRR